MYIVVIGLGEVGRHLMKLLVNEGHDLIAIDCNEEQILYAEDHFDVATLLGYGANQQVLKQARAGEADLVVAVTDHDEVNLIATLAAKQMGATRVVARVQGNEWGTATEGVGYGFLGVDVVINPRVLVAKEFARIARSHGADDVIDLADERVELVQLTLTDNSRHLGKPLAKVDLPGEVVIAAIVREGELFIPGGADVMLEGDLIYLMGSPSDVLRAEDVFSTRREAQRVCIVGGGVIGQTLASTLAKQGCSVLLIEANRSRAEEIGGRLDDITVVVGDGTNVELLEEEEVNTYDLFVAVTRHDEVNLMAALLAQRNGVDRTACVVTRGDYLPIYRQLGISIALSPRVVASDHILRYARRDSLHAITSIESGAAEVLELVATRGCEAIGVPLRRLSTPRGSIVGAIIRQDDVIIPHGGSQIRFGDRILIMCVPEARRAVEDLFRSREE